MKPSPIKALAVFSGGLDSILAVELMRAQDVDVLAFFFETPFFTSHKAAHSARMLDVPFKVVDITDRHLAVVRHPKHGYGSNMNPCIDCHALMCRMAGEMMDAEGARFVFTGEVLGQRPMSQNKKALATVAEESGLAGLLVRPLSAKGLPITIPEEKGWIRREELMGFQGRSRKPQMTFAQTLGITDYPSPGGGCLLTEQVFSRRLRDLFLSDQGQEIRNIQLLKLGRHFRLGPHSKLVVGRNKQENETILSLSKETDILLRPATVPGPTALLLGDASEGCVRESAEITAAYSDAEAGMRLGIRRTGLQGEHVCEVAVPEKQIFSAKMI